MNTIQNPILPGFAPDASALHVGEDYYIATSTCEWWPGIEIYHSKDLVNWQWVAGCGADAAPYFRIFNPDLQQKKFDPDGAYVSKWAPYSMTLPQIIDLKATRADALQAYHALVR